MFVVWDVWAQHTLFYSSKLDWKRKQVDNRNQKENIGPNRKGLPLQDWKSLVFLKTTTKWNSNAKMPMTEKLSPMEKLTKETSGVPDESLQPGTLNKCHLCLSNIIYLNTSAN